MNLNERLLDVLRLDPQVSFKVVLAYEDFSAGNHALNIINRLFPGYEQTPSFSKKNVWKFDMLEIAKFRDLAAAEALSADMILISAHDPKALPSAVKRWMDIWSKQRTDNFGALVVLLDSAKKRGIWDLWAESYLQACAIRAGMQLFIQREERRNVHLQSNHPMGSNEKSIPDVELQKIITGVCWRTERN